MKPAWPVIACLLLSPPLPGGKPAAAAQPKPTAVLAFAPAPGTVLTYDFTCLVNSTAVSFAGRELPFQAVSRGVIRLAVRSSRDGVTDVGLSSSGIDVSYEAGASADKYRLFVSDEKPVRLAFSRGGRILSARNGEALEKRNRMDFSVLDMIGFCFPALPDASRGVGDAWIDQRKISFPFQGMRIGVDLKLPFLVRDLGGGAADRIASLSAEPEVTLSGRGEFNDLAATVRGSGTGRLDLRFAAGRSVIEDYRLQAQVHGSIVTRSQGTTLFEWPLRLTLSIFLSRRPDSLLLP
jgi:hypothetical protein